MPDPPTVLNLITNFETTLWDTKNPMPQILKEKKTDRMGREKRTDMLGFQGVMGKSSVLKVPSIYFQEEPSSQGEEILRVIEEAKGSIK